MSNEELQQRIVELEKQVAFLINLKQPTKKVCANNVCYCSGNCNNLVQVYQRNTKEFKGFEQYD